MSEMVVIFVHAMELIMNTSLE